MSIALTMVVVVLIIHEWMLFQFERDLEKIKEDIKNEHSQIN
jgi:regulatory protein YycH of two-component signal transduction system YycFG